MKRLACMGRGLGMLGLLVLGSTGTARAWSGASAESQFQEMDTNHDGKLSSDEFVAAADRKFDAMDKNSDGRLTASELQASTQEHAARMAKTPEASMAQPQASMAQKMKQLDTNGDGVVSRDECENGARTKFVQMDTNKDDYLSKSEFAAGHAKMQQSAPSTNERP